jgi:DNA-binding MarR family transcriptional regulator
MKPTDDSASTPAPATLDEPSTDDTQLAPRLRLALMRLSRHLRSQLDGDLSPSLVSALSSVERHGPVTLGHLAELERVKPPSITRMVASLEAAGLVRRETDLADRRIARLQVTPAGERKLQAIRTRKTAYLAQRLRRLDDDDLDALRRALPVLERLLERE